MWIFLPGGLLMPATVPESADKRFALPGFDIQVRGRVDSHLTNFIRDYVDPMGFAHSKIEYTPQLDYNVRFYMNKLDLSMAVGAAVLDIDFLKFKPTAERKGADGKPLYKDGREYHDVLNSIWGSVTRLGRPGGAWGAYSGTNPRGYKPLPKVEFSSAGSVPNGYRPSQYPKQGATGSTFFRDDELELDDNWGYTPTKADEIENLLEELEGIPANQWEEFLDEREMKLMAPFMADIKKQERRNTRARRASDRKNRQTNRRSPSGRR